MAGPQVRHDMSRRRTLMKKSELLKRYGFRVFAVAYLGLIGSIINRKWLNPPEYATKEEEELANNKFGATDMYKRFLGYVFAFVSDKRSNFFVERELIQLERRQYFKSTNHK